MEAWWPEEDVDNPATSGVLLASYAPFEGSRSEELTAWIDDHHEVISQLLDAAETSDDVVGFLRFLLYAGVRWPVLVQRWARPGDVLILKTREVRPSGHDDVRTFVHDAEIRLAMSYHLQVHSPDPTVVIKKEVKASAGPFADDEVGFPENFEIMSSTEELFTAYASDPERVERVRFTVRFGLRHHVWAGYAFALALGLIALTAAGLLKEVTGDVAAVLTIPASLVAAVVLVRDAPLTARFLDRPRYLLIVATSLVWVVAMWRLIGWPWPGGH
jgi:hypothetical protein